MSGGAIMSYKELSEVLEIWEKKSTLTFYGQYLGCRSSRYGIDK